MFLLSPALDLLRCHLRFDDRRLPLALSKAGGISIAVIVHSLDRNKRGNRRFDDRRSHPTSAQSRVYEA